MVRVYIEGYLLPANAFAAWNSTRASDASGGVSRPSGVRVRVLAARERSEAPAASMSPTHSTGITQPQVSKLSAVRSRRPSCSAMSAAPEGIT